MPLDDLEDTKDFYQTEYDQGLYTICPSASELAELMSRGFKSTEKDYSPYIDVIRAAGLKPGERLLDFGCSWGLGSWQLKRAEFDVISHEVSRPRAEYAARYLDCNFVESPERAGAAIKCFFSAHVIEHIPDPEVWWRWVGQLLSPEGFIVCATPNGNPALERSYGSKRYHRMWGKVHPLLWTAPALKAVARQHGFTPYLFSSPYSPDRIRSLSEDEGLGEELLLIARRES